MRALCTRWVSVGAVSGLAFAALACVKSEADGICISGNCRNGVGTMVWPGGERYYGEFREGVIEGLGEYDWPNGDHFVGIYQKALFHGKGVLSFATGEQYEGDWAQGRRPPLAEQCVSAFPRLFPRSPL